MFIGKLLPTSGINRISVSSPNRTEALSFKKRMAGYDMSYTLATNKSGEVQNNRAE